MQKMTHPQWLLGLLLGGCAWAQAPQQPMQGQLNEVVVSDTKFEQQREQSGKVIEVIGAADLAAWKGQSVAQVLSSVAGLEINGNQSAPGKNLGYYVRGGRNRQAVIYIDGMPMTDPSGIAIEYDLRLLAADQVAQIEVLKGASSTLYGSGAATGVINIKLKQGSNKPLAFSSSSSWGTLALAKDANLRPLDARHNLQLSGQKGAYNYMFALNHQQADGFSEMAPFTPDEKPEADRMAKLNGLAKLGYRLNKALSIQLSAAADRLLNAFDDSYNGLSSSDNPHNMSYIRQYRLGVQPRWTHRKGEVVLAAGLTHTQRSIDQYNSWTASVDNYQYMGRQTNIDLYTKYQFSPQWYAVAGVQHQYLDMSADSPYGNVYRNETRFVLLDPYASVVWQRQALGVNVGGRINTHSNYSPQGVFHVNPHYSLGQGYKAIASFSTAYITPSLYQLFDGYSGNTALVPERNQTAEIGMEWQHPKRSVQWSVVGFWRTENRSILYNDSTYRYYNAEGDNNARGVEVSAKGQMLQHWQWSANYTFNQLDEALQRLNPKHKANAKISYQQGRWMAQLQGQFVDKRIDVYGYPGTTVSLDAYRLAHLMAQYSLIPGKMQVFMQCTNLFDEAFTEVSGYATLGRNYRLGLQLQL